MKKVITEKEVRKVYNAGSSTISINPGDIITPLARDTIKELGMTNSKSSETKSQDFPRTNKVAVGSDHTGYKLKEILKNELSKKSFYVIDVGTNNEDSCDYPDFALSTAYKVISGEADFGIVLDATGIPSAITANKVPGIRAATCYNEFSAWSARNHNNANLLVVGAKTIGEEAAKAILRKWLETNFEGGRHQKRLDKITRIEEKFFSKK